MFDFNLVRIKSPINKTKDADSGIKCLVYKSVLCIIKGSVCILSQPEQQHNTVMGWT